MCKLFFDLKRFDAKKSSFDLADVLIVEVQKLGQDLDFLNFYFSLRINDTNMCQNFCQTEMTSALLKIKQTFTDFFAFDDILTYPDLV